MQPVVGFLVDEDTAFLLLLSTELGVPVTQPVIVTERYVWVEVGGSVLAV